MRASTISLMLTILISIGTGYAFFRKSSGGSGKAATEVISTTGVQLDLITIAHAEQAYFATNGAFGNLDQLNSTGVIDKIPMGRDGFNYSVKISPKGFEAIADHPDANGHPTILSIDQDMKVKQGNQVVLSN